MLKYFSRGDFTNKRFPFPKRYWVYLITVLILSVLLIGNIYRTDSWTGEKQFSEFSQYDWHLFAVFLIEEIAIVGVLFLFAFLGNRISKKRNAEIKAQFEKDKYLGIKPGDYDYVWFDFGNTERALILKIENRYNLYVEEYDERTGIWENFNEVGIYDSLDSIKKALFYDFDFYCEKNAELDKYGEEIYKET